MFVLFQTDVWKSKKSRIFFGVFSTHKLAVAAAKKNDLYHNDAEVVILECKLDVFEEQ